MDSGGGALCVCVCVCVYLYLYLQHSEHQNKFFNQSEDTWAGPHNFKALFEGTGLILSFWLG